MFAKNRSRRGSAIAELGPALFVLLILIFFPMLDLMGAAADYAFANLLHNAEIREIAVRVPDEGQKETIAQQADKDFINTMPGYAQFCGIKVADVGNDAKIKHSIQYIKSDPANPDEITEVQVATTVSFKPFLVIPYMDGIPGLGGNMTFTVATTRPQEEKGKNG